MKIKKIVKYVVMVAISLCLALTLGGNTQTMAKSKVVKVKVTTKEKNCKFYGIVKGLDRNGNVVWKYKTPKEPAAELSCVLCKTRGNCVYIVTAGRFIRLNKNTGKILCNVKKYDLGGATSLNVQKNGVCYITTYYDNFLLKFSKKGKVIWKTDFNKTQYYWPYKVKVKKNKLYVWFDASNKNVKLPHKMVINKKNGKILSGA